MPEPKVNSPLRPGDHSVERLNRMRNRLDRAWKVLNPARRRIELKVERMRKRIELKVERLY